MDSINREQPENNRADLSGANAIKRIRETVIGAAIGKTLDDSIEGELRF